MYKLPMVDLWELTSTPMILEAPRARAPSATCKSRSTTSWRQVEFNSLIKVIRCTFISIDPTTTATTKRGWSQVLGGVELIQLNYKLTKINNYNYNILERRISYRESYCSQPKNGHGGSSFHVGSVPRCTHSCSHGQF